MKKDEILWTLKGLLVAVLLALVYLVVSVVTALSGHPLPDWSSIVATVILTAVLVASQVPMLRRVKRESEER